jgi:2-amino-4-hydroxy-6-hydroxymethyldihydropteridine diphosphokinase
MRHVIGRPAESIAAERGRTGTVIMLGSNIQPELHLPAAVRELQALGDVLAISSVWQTAPVGFLDQADFCNAAVLLETPLDSVELLARLRDIENRLGRVRDPLNKNAPRTIDLDLAVVPGPPRMVAGRMLPDPDLSKRVFLAIPLQEILPDFHLPSGRPISEVAAELRDRDAEKLRLRPRKEIKLGNGRY